MNVDNDVIKQLSDKLDKISEEVGLLRRSLLGSYDNPGGLAQRIAVVEQQLTAMWSKVDRANDELTDLKSWVAATKNRAIGVSIGVALGGAGIGASTASILIKLLSG